MYSKSRSNASAVDSNKSVIASAGGISSSSYVQWREALTGLAYATSPACCRLAVIGLPPAIG